MLKLWLDRHSIMDEWTDWCWRHHINSYENSNKSSSLPISELPPNGLLSWINFLQNEKTFLPCISYWSCNTCISYMGVYMYITNGQVISGCCISNCYSSVIVYLASSSSAVCLSWDNLKLSTWVNMISIALLILFS